MLFSSKNRLTWTKGNKMHLKSKVIKRQVFKDWIWNKLTMEKLMSSLQPEMTRTLCSNQECKRRELVTHSKNCIIWILRACWRFLAIPLHKLMNVSFSFQIISKNSKENLKENQHNPSWSKQPHLSIPQTAGANRTNSLSLVQFTTSTWWAKCTKRLWWWVKAASRDCRTQCSSSSTNWPKWSRNSNQFWKNCKQENPFFYTFFNICFYRPSESNIAIDKYQEFIGKLKP